MNVVMKTNSEGTTEKTVESTAGFSRGMFAGLRFHLRDDEQVVIVMTFDEAMQMIEGLMRASFDIILFEEAMSAKTALDVLSEDGEDESDDSS